MQYTILLTLLIACAAYLLGSICCAILVCRILHLPDPRTQGSHNPGATNVKRVGGTQAAALTLLGDALKGWLSVFAALYFNLPPLSVSLVLLAVFLGHLFPVFFQFKGGKGVATALGSLLALDLIFGLWIILTWLCTFGIFRISAVAALVSAAFTPLYALWLFDHSDYLGVLLIVSVFLFWTHRSNIKALLHKDSKSQRE